MNEDKEALVELLTNESELAEPLLDSHELNHI